MISEVIDRIDAQVAALAGRVRGAADLAQLQRDNRLPQVTPAAHVLPLGLLPSSADAATGFFTQNFDHVVGVVLTLRTGDGTGAGSLGDLEALIGAVIAALAGWRTAGASGVFRLVRGSIVTMTGGALVYQLDFAITDQLRIAT